MENAVEPVVLQIRGREFLVARTPAKEAGAISSTDDALGLSLRRPRPGCLRLRPSAKVWVGNAIFAAIGAGVIAWGAGGDLPGPMGGLMRSTAIIFGIVFMAIPLSYSLLLANRFEFDQDEGRLTRRGWHSAARPLADVLAVQMLVAPRNARPRTWELNLVLDDVRKQRWNLACHSKEQAMWHQANEIAEFLQVPVLDHRSAEEAVHDQGREYQVPLTAAHEEFIKIRV